VLDWKYTKTKVKKRRKKNDLRRYRIPKNRPQTRIRVANGKMRFQGAGSDDNMLFVGV